MRLSSPYPERIKEVEAMIRSALLASLRQVEAMMNAALLASLHAARPRKVKRGRA
jgi:hypothetical protein